jgi:hypothetical protein
MNSPKNKTKKRKKKKIKIPFEDLTPLPSEEEYGNEFH